MEQTSEDKVQNPETNKDIIISEDKNIEEQPIDEDGLQLLRDDLDKYFKN